VVTNAFNCFSLRTLLSAHHQKKTCNRNPCTRETVTLLLHLEGRHTLLMRCRNAPVKCLK
jgi:hypothetical protein